MKKLFGPTTLRLWLLLYPFTAAAMAINLFLLFLMLQALGIPATSIVAAWVTRLIDEAEGRAAN